MDPYAPIIIPVSGPPFDASGLVNKYSFQAEIEEVDGGNGGITLSGKNRYTRAAFALIVDP